MEEIAADKPARLALEAVARRPGGRAGRAGGAPARPAQAAARGAAQQAARRATTGCTRSRSTGVRVLARNERSKVQLFSDRGTPLPARGRAQGQADRRRGPDAAGRDADRRRRRRAADRRTATSWATSCSTCPTSTATTCRACRSSGARRCSRSWCGARARASIRYVEHIAGGGAGFLSRGVPAGDRGDGVAAGGIALRREGGVGDGRVREGEEEDRRQDETRRP